MKYPEHLLYTKDHEWIQFLGEQAVIGITDFAQKELGDIVYLDITTLNETLEREQIFGTVEAVKTVSDLFIPVSATVIEINTKVNDQPELVNKDPYGDGWIIRVTLKDPDDRTGLLTVEDYKKQIGA